MDNWTLNLLLQYAEADGKTIAATNSPNATHPPQPISAISTLNGVTLKVKPTLSADRRYVILDITPLDPTRPATPPQPPQPLRHPETADISTMVTIPDGGTLLIGGQKIAVPGSDPKAPPKEGTVLILIRTRIVNPDSPATSPRRHRRTFPRHHPSIRHQFFCRRYAHQSRHPRPPRKQCQRIHRQQTTS